MDGTGRRIFSQIRCAQPVTVPPPWLLRGVNRCKTEAASSYPRFGPSPLAEMPHYLATFPSELGRRHRFCDAKRPALLSAQPP